MSPGWKKWFSNNWRKIHKKKVNRPIYARDFHDPTGGADHQRRPQTYGLDASRNTARPSAAAPAPPQPPNVAADRLDRFGGQAGFSRGSHYHHQQQQQQHAVTRRGVGANDRFGHLPTRPRSSGERRDSSSSSSSFGTAHDEEWLKGQVN
jgi:hypothetical protein